jgi:hypothetical protein
VIGSWGGGSVSQVFFQYYAIWGVERVVRGLEVMHLADRRILTKLE